MLWQSPRCRRHTRPDNGRRAGFRRAAPPPTVEATLVRALDYLTTGLDEAAAARLRALAARSPAWAARCGYALGYLEGGADGQVARQEETR